MGHLPESWSSVLVRIIPTSQALKGCMGHLRLCQSGFTPPYNWIMVSKGCMGHLPTREAQTLGLYGPPKSERPSRFTKSIGVIEMVWPEVGLYGPPPRALAKLQDLGLYGPPSRATRPMQSSRETWGCMSHRVKQRDMRVYGSGCR